MIGNDKTPPFNLSNSEKITLIKKMMKESGLSQADLSRGTGQSEPRISGLMNGNYHISKLMFAAMYHLLKNPGKKVTN